jgi:hypothetical protein
VEGGDAVLTPQSVLIRYDRAELTLNLPIYFDEMPLGKIRKVFKLLEERPDQNETAHERLDLFFTAWERDTKDRSDLLTAELETARRDAEDKRRTVAVMGSTLDERIEQEKHVFERAKRLKKTDPERYEKYRAAYESVKRPKTEHAQAVKEVKRLESAVKTGKAAVERCGVIITAYKAIKANNN